MELTFTNIVAGALAIAIGVLSVLALLESRRLRLEEASHIVWDESESKREGDALERARRLLEGSGIQMTADEIVWIWLACAAVPPLAVGAAGGAAAAMVAAACVGAALPLLYVYTAKRRNKRRFEEQLGQTMPLIAANLKGGAALRQAITPVADNMDEPVRGEFRLLTADMARGMPVPDALDRMAERNESPDIALFASAVRAQAEGGGSLAEIVETVGETIRVRVAIRAEVRSKTSQGRATAAIMAVVPIALAAILFLTNDMYREFYASGTGLLVLGGCALFEALGYAVCKKLCDIKVD